MCTLCPVRQDGVVFYQRKKVREDEVRAIELHSERRVLLVEFSCTLEIA